MRCNLQSCKTSFFTRAYDPQVCTHACFSTPCPSKSWQYAYCQQQSEQNALVIHLNGPHLCVSDISLQLLLVLTFVLQEMVIAPLSAVAVGLPLLVDVQQRQMVTLRNKELLSCRVTLLSSVWGPEEHVWHTQHGHNCQHLHHNMPAVDTAVTIMILLFIAKTVALTMLGA